jgi:hypothetical protein
MRFDGQTYQFSQLPLAGRDKNRRADEPSRKESEMDENEARNAIKVTVLSDLSAICKKVADDPVVPDDLRARAGALVDEFNELAKVRGRGNAAEHAEGEALLTRMARFLPRINELQSTPADAKGVLQE